MMASTALRLLYTALIALVVSNVLWLSQCRSLAGQRDAARAARETLRADVATQRATFEAQARTREREQSAALAGIRTIFDQELMDAHAEHETVVAALRADTLRLRSHWQGCVATAELSASVTTAARTDDGAHLREQGAADLVRAGAECDARIRGLQSAVRTYSEDTP